MNNALIVGATSDMAVALAKLLAEKGCNLYLTARNQERLLPLKQDLTLRFGVSIQLIEQDVCNDQSQNADWLEAIKKTDTTIFVAGYMTDNEEAMENASLAQRVIQTNFTSAVVLLNAVALEYKKRKSGTIVGISSVAGDRGRGSNFIYGSAKGGFTLFLNGLRNYLNSSGVNVITVKPGFVATKMTAHLDLPAPLTAQPESIAKGVYRAIIKKKRIVYISWKWKYIMLVIKSIPEFIFVKLKL